MRGLSLDHRALARRRGVAAQPHDLERGGDRREWVAQLVAEHGQELILGAARLLGLLEERRLLRLGGLAVVDVGVDADPAHDAPVAVADGAAARQEPAPGAVVATEAELHLEGRAAGQALLPAREDARQVVGIVDRLPAPALHLGGGGAGELVPAAVVVVDEAVGARGPAELRHRLEQRLQHGARAGGGLVGGALVGEAARGLERERRAHRQLLGEGEIVLVVRRRVGATLQREDADGGVADDHRDDHRRAAAERAEEREVRGGLREGGEVGVGDLAEEHAAARAGEVVEHGAVAARVEGGEVLRGDGGARRVAVDGGDASQPAAVVDGDGAPVGDARSGRDGAFGDADQRGDDVEGRAEEAARLDEEAGAGRGAAAERLGLDGGDGDAREVRERRGVLVGEGGRAREALDRDPAARADGDDDVGERAALDARHAVDEHRAAQRRRAAPVAGVVDHAGRRRSLDELERRHEQRARQGPSIARPQERLARARQPRQGCVVGGHPSKYPVVRNRAPWRDARRVQRRRPRSAFEGCPGGESNPHDLTVERF